MQGGIQHTLVSSTWRVISLHIVVIIIFLFIIIIVITFCVHSTNFCNCFTNSILSSLYISCDGLGSHDDVPPPIGMSVFRRLSAANRSNRSMST